MIFLQRWVVLFPIMEWNIFMQKIIPMRRSLRYSIKFVMEESFLWKNGQSLNRQCCMFLQYGIMKKDWVQQYHLGALRNNNIRLLDSCGPDTGWDSIGDFQQAKTLTKFLGRLDSTNQLAKTILYNLNPADNELMATMTGNFNDGTIPGKIQFGSAWWFLDQKDGMTKQMNALSNMGLISRFVGMITDSRSFLSYPRHEYFRRFCVICLVMKLKTVNCQMILNGQEKSLRIFAITMRRIILVGNQFTLHHVITS